MDDHIDASNPFAASVSPVGNHFEDRQSSALPGYVKAWAIVALVFSSLRVIMTALSAFGALVVKPDNPLYPTVAFEVASNAGFAIFGLIGNILLLMKKPISLIFCKLMVVMVVLNIGVGIWQGLILVSQIVDPAQQMGGYGGLAFTALIRAVLIGFYIAAIVKAHAYFAERD
ncbi:hypothetical protein [Aeoliella sp.]|uniref:hypothetical protein n=1 Tax=Aeoliella sp. TaxID=2795800 RepID=UPI003CCBC899